MDLETLKTLFSDLLTSTGIIAMGAAAGVAVLAAVYDALRSKTFSFSLLPGWLMSKVVEGILPVMILHVAALAFAEPVSAAFKVAASGGAAMFIAAQVASVNNHMRAKSPEDPVPDEGLGG